MQLDIANLPVIASNMFGISVFAGGIFCTLLVTTAIMIPIFWVTQGKGMPYTVIIIGCLSVFFGVSVGWLAEILGILIAGAVALGYAYLFGNVFDGGE